MHAGAFAGANPREDIMAKHEGEKSLREQQLDARKKRMAELNPPARSVRVTPANDDLRRVLKHPRSGTKFPASGSVEWPLDQFTRRRIKEGAVTVEERQQEGERGATGRERRTDDARRQPPGASPGSDPAA